MKLSNEKLALLKRYITLNSTDTLQLALELLESDRDVPKPARSIAHAFTKPPAKAAALIEKHLCVQSIFSPYHDAYRTLVALEHWPESPSPILINDTRTQNNVGCLATTSNLLGEFARQGVSFAHTVTLGDISLMEQLLRLYCRAKPGDVGPGELLEAFTVAPSLGPYRRLVARAGAMVVNGEGSFYDRQGKGIVLLALMRYAQVHADCQVLLINHSASLNDAAMRDRYRDVYSDLAFVSFRESHSAKRLPPELSVPGGACSTDAAFLEPGLAGVTSEPPALDIRAFSIYPDHLHARSLEPPYVVLSGSSSLFRHDRQTVRAIDGIANLVGELLATGFDVCFYAADQQDYRVGRAVALKFGLPVLAPSTPREKLIHVLGHAAAYISGRWHASILSIVAGTVPILGDANFFKTEALHVALALPWDLFSFNLLRTESRMISDRVVRIQGERDAWRTKMLEFAAGERDKARTMVSAAAKILHTSGARCD